MRLPISPKCLEFIWCIVAVDEIESVVIDSKVPICVNVGEVDLFLLVLHRSLNSNQEIFIVNIFSF